jgi:predicted Zn finger-like uncharacterized protein
MEQLATQCPHCRTQFRVTMAQLELREGQVRCGACREIFNGIDHVYEYTGEQEFLLTPPAAEQDLSDRMTLIDFGSLRDAPETGGPSMQEELDALSRAIADLQSKPWAEPPTTPRSEFGDEDIGDPQAGDARDSEVSADDTGLDSTSDDTPGFVQQARNRERSARLWKLLLWIGIPLLMLSLAAQLVYFFRSEIAARSPEAARYLHAICRHADCTISLPMQLDQLSLAASRLEQVGADGNAEAAAAASEAAPTASVTRLTLVALLRNKGDLVQAWPSLDLTLKDAEGGTVVRKSFLPEQYLKAREIRDGMSAHSEREIRIAFELDGESPAGFDLTIFYH